MKISLQKGFTLIELLVVIAIIALLSAVVMVSLNVARTKGGDSAVKAGMKQMLTQAQTYLDTNTNLGASVANCTAGVFADPQFAQIRANVLSNAATGAIMNCATDSTGSKWAVSVALKSGPTWCVDNSQGWFKAGVAQTSGGAQGMCQ
ncbi:MAG: type II secretion system protein [Patescibacteria group bacterium]|nr:type II secretion system protein [Patescibacteria group bacterium]